jgi:hypothetical protein
LTADQPGAYNGNQEATGEVPEKYEREIEEILRKASFSAPRGYSRSSGWMSHLASAWRRYTADLSPTRLLVLGMIVAFAGYLVRAVIPQLGFLTSLLALVLLVTGLALSISRRNSYRPRSWRGQAFDLPRNDLWSELKRWWDNWRHRRPFNGPGWR